MKYLLNLLHSKLTVAVFSYLSKWAKVNNYSKIVLN
jgi:hypothetical protein